METSKEIQSKAVKVVREMLAELESDINLRNSYMNTRYGMVYENGIMVGLDIKPGHDLTRYNYLPRVVDIHSSQLFGRLPQIVTTYDKEDLSIFDIGQTNPDESKVDKEKARLRNARKATDAEVRNTAIRNIQRDNDFEEMIARGGDIGAWSGVTVIKGWLDKKAKTYRYSLIEQPQNFARYWSNSNFRDYEADFYMYQISLSSANRLYGKKLSSDETFAMAQENTSWWRASESPDLQTKTIPKVWVIDATGYFRGLKSKGGVVSEADAKDENRFNMLIVGDQIVEVNDSNVPTYWVTNHEDQPGKPWGRSALPDELISVNQTMIETMSDWRTASWKMSFPKFKGIGLDAMNMPSMENRSSAVIPLGEGQDLEPLTYANTLPEFPRLMQELWNSFTKLAKVSRVMLDDPTIDSNSNQGLMTTMKPLIDAVENRQKRWTSTLIDMFTVALKEVATLPGEDAASLKEAVNEQDWAVQTKWPSVLRREDAAYQQMYNNRILQGTIDFTTYLEAMGDDAGEVIDRMRDDMTDPLRAAVLGKQLTTMAGALLTPPPAPAEPKVNISLRGDMTPQQEANLATKNGFNDGPFPPSMGPQGSQGLAAGENADNAGMIAGNPYHGGTPINRGPDGQPVPQSQPAPVLTPDQNTGAQTVSQPGSGAPAVTPQGQINQMAQRAGV